jgi:exonuclease III
MYALYSERKQYWDTIKDQHFLVGDYLILGGDPNLTLNAKECWGERVRIDPLIDYSYNLVKYLNLVDVEPHNVVPTWWNSKRGRDMIAKRLDQFLVVESFFEEVDRHKTLVGLRGISDHVPIFL